MKLRIVLVCCFLSLSLVYGEASVWLRIKELSQFDTAQGNPQLEAYLQTLTRPQMLEAGRECCKQATDRIPQERWEEGVLPMALILSFYANQDGALSEDALNQLLDCLASENEMALFRETILRLLRQRYWEQLTENQYKQSRQCFLAIFLDKKTPERLRVLSCHELAQALAENHRRIIISDTNVQLIRNDKQKWRKIDELVQRGDIRLESETLKALDVLQDKITNITSRLTKLSQDSVESEQIKDAVKNALKILSHLVLPPKQ
jgi:hypothetical protein